MVHVCYPSSSVMTYTCSVCGEGMRVEGPWHLTTTGNYEWSGRAELDAWLVEHAEHLFWRQVQVV